MELKKVLKEFGLNNKEASVYLACLELGEASVSAIARRAQTERSGTYYILNSLLKKGVINRIPRKDKDYFLANNPESLIDQLNRQKELLSSHLEEFRVLENLGGKKPKIRLYEGIEGLKNLFNKTLEKKNSEILAITTFSEMEKTALFYGKENIEWAAEYIKRRKKKNVFSRVIADDSPEGFARKKKDKEEFRETRLLSLDKYDLQSEISICDKFIIIISYKDLIGVLIESEKIAKTQKVLFDLAWRDATRLVKKS